MHKTDLALSNSSSVSSTTYYAPQAKPLEALQTSVEAVASPALFSNVFEPSFDKKLVAITLEAAFQTAPENVGTLLDDGLNSARDKNSYLKYLLQTLKIQEADNTKHVLLWLLQQAQLSIPSHALPEALADCFSQLSLRHMACIASDPLFTPFFASLDKNGPFQAVQPLSKRSPERADLLKSRLLPHQIQAADYFIELARKKKLEHEKDKQRHWESYEQLQMEAAEQERFEELAKELTQQNTPTERAQQATAWLTAKRELHERLEKEKTALREKLRQESLQKEELENKERERKVEIQTAQISSLCTAKSVEEAEALLKTFDIPALSFGVNKRGFSPPAAALAARNYPLALFFIRHGFGVTYPDPFSSILDVPRGIVGALGNYQYTADTAETAFKLLTASLERARHPNEFIYCTLRDAHNYSFESFVWALQEGKTRNLITKKQYNDYLKSFFQSSSDTPFIPFFKLISAAQLRIILNLEEAVSIMREVAPECVDDFLRHGLIDMVKVLIEKRVFFLTVQQRHEMSRLEAILNLGAFGQKAEAAIAAHTPKPINNNHGSMYGGPEAQARFVDDTRASMRIALDKWQRVTTTADINEIYATAALRRARTAFREHSINKKDFGNVRTSKEVTLFGKEPNGYYMRYRNMVPSLPYKITKKIHGKEVLATTTEEQQWTHCAPDPLAWDYILKGKLTIHQSVYPNEKVLAPFMGSSLWWASHYMPCPRGSAAIEDVVLNTLWIDKDFAPPAKIEGHNDDCLALVREEDLFVEWYSKRIPG